MANNEEILKMDPKKNAGIKSALMKASIFEKTSYTPYIGDGYEDAKEKILFIGDCKLPNDERFLEETKDFPKVNYCTQIISYCNRDTTKRKIRNKIKNEMNLDSKRVRPTFAYPQKIQNYINNAPRISRIFRINHTKPEDFIKILERLKSGQGEIRTNKSTKSVTVCDTNIKIEQMNKAHQIFDVRKPPKSEDYIKSCKNIAYNVAYYNFVYDRLEQIKNGTIKKNDIPSGNNLNKYFKALAIIIDKLNPKKIVFVDSSTESEINDRKQSCYFGNKKFNKWIEAKGIIKDVISSTNNVTDATSENSSDSIRNEDDLKICIDNIGDIGTSGSILGDLYDICDRHFDDKERFKKLLTEKFISYDAFFDSSHLEKLLNDSLHLDPFDSLFSNGMFLNDEETYSLFACLKNCVIIRNVLKRLKCQIDGKKAYQTRQERTNEKKAKYIEFMLDMIHPEHLYIAHTLIPSFFKYIDQKSELEDEMPIGEQNISTDEFNHFLEEKYNSKNLENAQGIGKTLDSIYRRFYSDKDKHKYAKMMEESIFINKEKREIWQLWNKKELKDSGYNMWKLRFNKTLE